MRALGQVDNTRAAFLAASELGVRYIESDCHVTRDGVVVLFHDEDLAQVTGEHVRVDELTYAELAERMDPLGGLLTLEEALAEFPDHRFNIDIKSRAATEPAAQLLGRHPERTLIASFDDRVRKRAMRVATLPTVDGAVTHPAVSPGQWRIIGVMCAVLTRCSWLIDRALRGLDALQIPERHLSVPVLTKRLLREAHRRGVEVHVWTVNDEADMRRLIAFGVDGLVTDRSDIGLRVAAENTE